jgi:F-type H+-transporting ATPase subunit a
VIESPLSMHALFHIGPVAVTTPVVTTWVLMALLALGSRLLTLRLAIEPGRLQAATELVVTTIERQIDDVLQTDGRRFLPLVGTIFLYLALANLSEVVPGVKSPTAHLETAAALALVVFCAIHYFGVRSRGLWGYLRHFARPTVWLLPINLLSDVTRIFSLMIRLFGNVMSGGFLLAIAVALAGVLVPIPLMALEMLIGLVQAYIFTILATVFIGAAVGVAEA